MPYTGKQVYKYISKEEPMFDLPDEEILSLSKEHVFYTLSAQAKAGMAQVVPVCAVMGGILGNEIIKVISGKGEPANNTILFDGLSCKGITFLVQPKKE